MKIRIKIEQLWLKGSVFQRERKNYVEFMNCSFGAHWSVSQKERKYYVVYVSFFFFGAQMEHYKYKKERKHYVESLDTGAQMERCIKGAFWSELI